MVVSCVFIEFRPISMSYQQLEIDEIAYELDIEGFEVRRVTNEDESTLYIGVHGFTIAVITEEEWLEERGLYVCQPNWGDEHTEDRAKILLGLLYSMRPDFDIKLYQEEDSSNYCIEFEGRVAKLGTAWTQVLPLSEFVDEDRTNEDKPEEVDQEGYWNNWTTPLFFD